MFEDIHSVGKDTHIIETMIIERGHTQSICLEPAKKCIQRTHFHIDKGEAKSALLKKDFFLKSKEENKIIHLPLLGHLKHFLTIHRNKIRNFTICNTRVWAKP